MITKIFLCLMCLHVSVNYVTHAHHPLVRELLRSGALQKAVDLKNLKENVNFTEIFSSQNKDVVVSDLGNKIMKVAGNLPAKISGERLQDHWSSGSETFAASDLKGSRSRHLIEFMKDNGTLIIQGESYMELLDPQDIVDPILLLQKISMGINRKPVSVSLPVSEPYFIFSAPRVADTAPRITDTAPRVTDNAPRVTDTTPRVTDTAPRVTDNYTGTSNVKEVVKTTALIEALKLNRVRRHHPSVLSSVLSRLQSYALVPIKTPTGATRYLLMKNPKFIVQQSGNSQQQSKSQPRLSSPGGAPQVPSPVPAGNQWVVPPMKRKRISISIMPREAGGGGLTAANTGNIARAVTSSTYLQTVPSVAKSSKAATTNLDSATVKPKTTPASSQVATAATSAPPGGEGTTLKLGGIVSKMAVIASGFSKPQEIIDFKNAKADALRRLDAVIMNKAERQDVIGFAKSLLKAMKLLNVVVVKHGERRDTAVFAQAMLSGLKRLDDIFKKGTKQQVVSYAKTMIDAIKMYDVEANPNSGAAMTSSTTTTTEPTTITTDTTTTDVPEEPPPTTTEEYEMEATTVNYYYDYYSGGTGTASLVDYYPTGGVVAAQKQTKPQSPPGVAGWQGGTTPEPALGPLDRVLTTDVPEEIEARPDKTPAEKRRDFLERNPHLRGKLPPLIPTKAPPNRTVQSQTNKPEPTPAKTTETPVKKKKPQIKKKENGNLKISGSQSTTTARDRGHRNRPPNNSGHRNIPSNNSGRRNRPSYDIYRRNIPLYRRLNSEFQRRAMVNPWIYLFG